MVGFIILIWTLFVLAVIGSDAAGEFKVLHSPASLTFLESDQTYESLLKEIFSAALGLSIEEDSEWRGLHVMDPFNTPEAAVEVYIDGIASLGDYIPTKIQTYPLIVDEYEPDTYRGVKHRINTRFSHGGNKIVNIKLSDDNALNVFKGVFDVIPSSEYSEQNIVFLKNSIEEDRHFLDELGTLRNVIGRVQSGAIISDNIIDFYTFRFRNLHALSDLYGPISLQTKEAKKLLGEALRDLCKAYVKAYDRSVLITVVTTDVAHTRRAARSLGLKGPDDPDRPGTSKPVWPFPWIPAPPGWQKHPHLYSRADGSPDYDWIQRKEGGDENSNKDEFSNEFTAIFNIFLWLGLLLSFSMLAVIYACMDLDPGRDSIIYRMTSTRMKKDN
uniref:Renin receptor n=1 Tax=Heliothis virescens TaxID=7102 RepID=A0A2A4JVN8_HELVI